MGSLVFAEGVILTLFGGGGITVDILWLLLWREETTRSEEQKVRNKDFFKPGQRMVQAHKKGRPSSKTPVICSTRSSELLKVGLVFNSNLVELEDLRGSSEEGLRRHEPEEPLSATTVVKERERERKKRLGDGTLVKAYLEPSEEQGVGRVG